MILRRVSSVLITLVFCTAENAPRWSKPDQDPRQGDWVPLNSERLNPEATRIPSAISPQQQVSQPLLRNPSPHQFEEEYQQKQVFAPPHGAPTRIALLHPQSLNPQAVLQQQIPSQQLLSQFLNQQIEQSSLPIFSRALLQGQPGLNPNFYSSQENYNLKPLYNQFQEFQNSQYHLDPNRDVEQRYEEKDKNRGNSAPQKIQETDYSDDTYNKNVNSSATNEKEEVQILYVPVEMLKKQEQAKTSPKNIQIKDGRHLPLHNTQNTNLNVYSENNQKEARKFRHPIQPLKEQMPAYHLRGSLSQGKLLSDYPESDNEKAPVKNTQKQAKYSNPRPTSTTRSEYTPTYNTNNVGSVPYPTVLNKEQIGDESTIQDEVSEFRNTGPTRRTPQKENANRQLATLPPPNQPPLSVFMETTPTNRVGDVLGLLKDSKTIPVLDAIGSHAPQVFVGPSNLNTPTGYIKFELPYLSSLNSNNAGQKLSQVPFFVAPLNFQPPPGFAKIPFPPPHIGSVVLSNITSHSSVEEGNISTPSSLDQQTANYKDAFTIPADISSISPQLPSLINSLQEDEFAGISSTESLTEPTEVPSQRYRRPTNSRRHNYRGSQRASIATSTTTRRPSSRQRKPSTRYFNQHNNQQAEPKENIPDTSAEDNYFTYKANRRPEFQQTPNLPAVQMQKNAESLIEEQHSPGNQYTGSRGDDKQEQRNIEQNKENYFPNNPALLNYPTEDQIIHPNDGRSGIVYKQGRTENIEQPMAQLFHDVRASVNNQYQKDLLNSPASSDLTQNHDANDFSLPQKHALMKQINNFEHSSYHSNGGAQLKNDGSVRNNDYEELNYKTNLNTESSTIPENQNQQNNYRAHNRFSDVQSGTSEESRFAKTQAEQENLSQNVGRNQYWLVTDDAMKNQNSGNTYLETSEVQNTSPSISGQSEEPKNFGETRLLDKLSDAEYQPKYQNENIQQTSLKNDGYNGQINNYESEHNPETPTTERIVPVKPRSRFRGKNYNQVQQTQPTVPAQTHHFSENPEKTSVVNRNKFTNNRQNSGNYEQDVSYTVPRENYPSHYATDQTTSTPIRKFAHGRAGRRPLRPTASTTSTTTSTTTSAPPGKKYLIRTRKPTIGQTRLQTGRGRIRRPTTPTTTTTTTTAPTTVVADYPKTLPFQWRQPVAQEEYNIKEDFDSPFVNPVEYTRPREALPYHEVKTSELQHPQSGREDQYQKGRHRSQNRAEMPRRIPNYSLGPGEDNTPAQKHYETTEGSHYSTTYEKARGPQNSRDYESTEKSHFSRDYETTQTPQHSREFVSLQKQEHSTDQGTVQKPHYPREYDEATEKAHYTHEYEVKQKPYYPQDYETTQKPNFSREYETTPKPYYTRQYETTRKTYHSRELETTLKPQSTKEYEPTEKSQYYKNYDTAQKPQSIQEPEHVPNSPQYDEYEVTNKPAYANDYETTHKPNPVRDYETTRKAQTYQEYDTTQNPYIHQEEVPQKSYNSNPSTRNHHHNHRRRPISTSRGESKHAKHQQPEMANNKETNNDFWNQAVTIQQSQSYVYTPDGNLSPTEETSNSDANAKASPLQSDYDDYYNFQEGGQYTSDQSPFPSNDQHIIYTKLKPSQEVGKANQYPEKPLFDKTLPEEIILEEEPSPNNTVDQKGREEQNLNSEYSTADQYDSKFISEQDETKEQISLTQSEEKTRPEKDPEMKEPGSRQQTGRRRGTWVRVRVKKPKEVFEAAESQRFSSVRENSLIPDVTHPKLLGDKSVSQKSVSNMTEKLTEPQQSERESITTLSSENNESSNESNTLSLETKVSEASTISEFPQASDSLYTTDANTETGSQNEQDQNLTTISSIIIPQEETTTLSNPETFRTSTTTEISLETEICYKGQCIKTKRKKEEKNRNLEITK